MKRRTLLKHGSLVGGLLLAGCTSGSPGASDPTQTPPTSQTTTEATSGTTATTSTSSPAGTTTAATGTTEPVTETYLNEHFIGKREFFRTTCGSNEPEFVESVKAGSRNYVLGVGIRGTKDCEEITVLEHSFSPETRQLDLVLGFMPRADASGCHGGCAVTYQMYTSYGPRNTNSRIETITVSVRDSSGTRELGTTRPE